MAVNGSNPKRVTGPERNCWLCRTAVFAPNSIKAKQPKDRRQLIKAQQQEREANNG